MKICIPVTEDRGLASPLCGHFGSAPAFLMFDTESRAHKVVVNDNMHHEHGKCVPVGLLADEHVDAVVVGGIGAGALAKILATGAVVYRGRPGPAAATLEALAGGQLPHLTPAETCSHGHGS
jgi:predicted Fe-Mo cluster-binding NifX family protein